MQLYVAFWCVILALTCLDKLVGSWKAIVSNTYNRREAKLGLLKFPILGAIAAIVGLMFNIPINPLSVVFSTIGWIITGYVCKMELISVLGNIECVSLFLGIRLPLFTRLIAIIEQQEISQIFKGN